MRRSRGNPGHPTRWIVLLLGAILAQLISGCASTNEENLSERPWNSPKSWETGLPAGMMDERR